MEKTTEGNLAYKLDCHYDPLPVEVIDGKVVLMAPIRVTHSRVTHNLTKIFDKFLEGKPCEYFPDGVGVYFSDDEHYIPDGMVVCDPEKVQEKGIMGAPDLVIEVLSPSTARYDRGHKRDVYESHGVREYWIVSPTDRSVEQYVLDGDRFRLVNAWQRIQYIPWTGQDDEKDEGAEEFPCAIFPDLIVRLDDVFGKATV